jgi:hypothetical protein
MVKFMTQAVRESAKNLQPAFEAIDSKSAARIVPICDNDSS